MKTFSWDEPPNLEAAYLSSEDIEECGFPSGKAGLLLAPLGELLKNHQEAIEAAGEWIDEAVSRAGEVRVAEMFAEVMPPATWGSLCYTIGRGDADNAKRILRDWLSE